MWGFRKRMAALVISLAAAALVAALQGVMAQSAPAAIEYRLIDLGDLGGQSSTPKAINAYHQVAGTSYSDEEDPVTHQRYRRAFLWTPSSPGGDTGSMVDLGTLGGNESLANGINSRGQVVGTAQRADGQFVAFLWSPVSPNSPNGTMVELPPPNGGQLASALCINDFGQVGGQIVGARSFLFTPADPNGAAGTVTEFNNLTITSINNFGQFTGTIAPQGGGLRAYVFTPNSEHGNQGDFDLLPLGRGFGTADGADINTFGHVSGYQHGQAGDIGFLQRESQQTSTGTLGGEYSLLSALNNVNPPWSVGISTDTQNALRGVLFRDSQLIDLNDLVGEPQSGPVIVTWAYDIAADQAIAAQYVEEGGIVPRAALLTRQAASSLEIKLFIDDDETLVGKSKFGFEVKNTSKDKRVVKVTLGLDQAPVIAQFGPASAYKGPGRASAAGRGTFEISSLKVKPGQIVKGKHLIQAVRPGEYEITAHVQTTDNGAPLTNDALPLQVTVGELIPESVTTELEIVRGPQEGTGRTVTQKVTLTNRGPAGAATSVARDLSGPFYLVTDGLSRGELSRPDGKTAKLQPLGSPYIKLNRPVLKAGKKLSATLKFKRPAGVKEDVLYSLRVLAGKGTP